LHLVRQRRPASTRFHRQQPKSHTSREANTPLPPPTFKIFLLRQHDVDFALTLY
jgi:hypothetical protein